MLSTCLASLMSPGQGACRLGESDAHRAAVVRVGGAGDQAPLRSPVDQVALCSDAKKSFFQGFAVVHVCAALSSHNYGIINAENEGS
jgi:hypothetical protein